MKKISHSPLSNFVRDESGSASVEFVILAVPLFLSILLFINSFAQLSNSELVARTLVRESLRAYVTSIKPDHAAPRANEALMVAARAENLTQNEIDSMHIVFECSADPCLSAGGRVRAILSMKAVGQGNGERQRVVTAEAEEYISPWQWNGTGKRLNLGFEIDFGGFDFKFGG